MTVGRGTDADLTLREAAAELGVHYMTAYRYVRLGVLPATKSGGTWRVARADLAVLGDAGRADPGSGLPSTPTTAPGQASAPGSASAAGLASAAGSASAARSPRRRVRWEARLEARLLAGDAAGTWAVVEAALAGGMGPDEVYLLVLTPAMRSIGDRWESGEIDVAVEHRASGIAMRVIGRLGPRFMRRGRRRGNVVIGAPAGERHAIAVAMLADLIRADGWDVSDLGADVPTDSLVHAATTMPDVMAVALSITSIDHLDTARDAFAAIRRAAPEVLLVAGGAALQASPPSRSRRVSAVVPPDAASLGVDAVVRDAEGLTSLLVGRSTAV